MNGEQKCRILKEIRQQIAQENNIELITKECTHKGDCRGTCPRCEAEVIYLEQKLEKRRKVQKRIALAGISAGITLSLSSCAIVDQTLETLSQRIQSLKPYSEKTVSVDEVGNGSQGTGSGGEELIVDGEIGPYDYNGLTGMMDS